ncbi:uncharacterized protein C8orf58 homolog [Spea bombifrons]|uniref:uncharacterized protein C8orf58 homolog n=1 Tax=Spea bombifrons TaxID=233779 RepID=UPI00234BEBEF|nr:uncharacterized protein C8orf58 homolog [Spea bombifrons]
MLGRHRKLTLGSLSSGGAGHSDDCVLVSGTAVYRRLMDSSLDTSSLAFPGYSHEKEVKEKVIRGRLQKSVSEDSGVELPPHSPFGSESSYSNEEAESLEMTYPEEPEVLKTSVPEEPSIFRDSSSEETDILEVIASLKSESVNEHSYGAVARERDIEKSVLPHKLEQAVLRSKRQRYSPRDRVQNRPARNNPCTLKCQQRGKSLSHCTRSPPLSHPQNEEPDPLLLPGEGLQYLEDLCLMLEQVAELQQRNQRLQQEKRQAERRLRSRAAFVDSYQCVSSRPSKVLQNDTTDGNLPNARPWESHDYRKRASSYTGILNSLPQQPDNRLKKTDKVEPRFVSVPNLQDSRTLSRSRNYKGEASQWEKVKDLLSKLTRKASGSTSGPRVTGTISNCRSQSLLEGSSHAPRRLFLPNLVIRPSRNQGRHRV